MPFVKSKVLPSNDFLLLEVFTKISFLQQAQTNSHDFVEILKTAIMKLQQKN